MPAKTQYVTRRELNKRFNGHAYRMYFCFLILIVVVVLLLLFNITLWNQTNLSSSPIRPQTVKWSAEQRFFHYYPAHSERARVSRGVYYLGQKQTPYSAKPLSGYALHLYVNSSIDKDSRPSKITSPCVEPFALGAIWYHTENYVISTANDQGLNETVTLNAIWRGMCEWDSRIERNLFGNHNPSLIVDGLDTSSPDGKNEIMFGNIHEEGVLAVTILWGNFAAAPFDRELYEADIMFNLNYRWGDATLDSGLIDVQAVATHEFGHYIGYGHVPSPDATMYFSARVGETKKRTLADCEVVGHCQYYGQTEDCGSNFTCSPRPTTSGGAPVPIPNAAFRVSRSIVTEISCFFFVVLVFLRH